MPHFHPRPFARPLLALLLGAAPFAVSQASDEIVIDGGPAASAEPSMEITIDAGGPASGEISIDSGSAPAGGDEIQIGGDMPPAAAMASDDADSGRFSLGIDEARAEYGHFTRSGSATDQSLYGKLAASANWQPNPTWELQLAGRVDGYDEDHVDSFTTVRGDYGDSYFRYRGDNLTLTLGTQTAIWGRIDELPLADRVSTADLTRGPLDDLEDRRRSNPMLRAETFVGGGKLDLAWLVDFRAAELPDADSAWYPIDRRRGRLLGIDPAAIPPAAVQGATVIENAPGGDGGFGARYTRTHSFADVGMTIARTRQSVPYFRSGGAGVFVAEYPRSWAYGVDAAMSAMGATWRFEALYSSDNPVTRSNLSYTTTPALQWGAGVEFFPGDGDSRVNLQIVGMNLIDAPAILDRAEIYSLNGEIEVPFDRERWRAGFDFYAGLDAKDIYLNPEITFLGWEPHELYLAAHYFAGDERTIGGFYEDNTSINLGWRAKF